MITNKNILIREINFLLLLKNVMIYFDCKITGEVSLTIFQCIFLKKFFVLMTKLYPSVINGNPAVIDGNPAVIDGNNLIINTNNLIINTNNLIVNTN